MTFSGYWNVLGRWWNGNSFFSFMHFSIILARSRIFLTLIQRPRDTAAPGVYGTNPERFHYTLDTTNNLLTEDQRKFYDENGFIIIRNCVSPEKLEKYRYRL